MITPQEKVHIVALGMVPGIGTATARQLIAHCGSAENVFKVNKSKLLKVPGVGEVLSNQILKRDTLLKADKLIQSLPEGVRLVFLSEPDYPAYLKEIPDAPLYLYWQGNLPPNFERGIAIVGTRLATEYGQKITEQIVRGLAPFHPVIVSGFAYGIDIIAHKAALDAGLATVAVLGSGLHNVYPSVHRKYVQEVMANGAMVTEYPLQAKPDAVHFPARNRIVAGMVSTVVVMEAAESGGALITAELANGYDREVFAVPGSLGNKFSEGCNKLISNNLARIYTGIDDLVQSLGWQKEGQPAASTKSAVRQRPQGLNELQEKVYGLLSNQTDMHIDMLSWKSELSMNQLASILLELEFSGLVKPLPGKKFKLV